MMFDMLEFQSTRPVRGATFCRCRFRQPDVVSIHAPRAGRDGAYSDIPRQRTVSIHAPRAGRDIITSSVQASALFQSTRPVRGATGI